MSGLLKAAKIAARVGRGLLAERLLTVLTRLLIDAPMVYLFIEGYSIYEVVGIFIPWCFIFYIVIIYIYDYFVAKGYDLLGLDYLVKLQDQEISKEQIFKRLARWIVKRKVTIFLIGSLFELDPDVVAILLRKEGERGVRILALSVVYSIVFWSIIYWLAVKGYRHFSYFMK